ncbi:MAG TPA: ABC transporter permease [Terriglobia bacterium]|nr:ABC transporter permease [Terriglobia bacterium]
MKTPRRFVRRLTWWATTERDEDRLRAEIDAHIALQTEDNIRAGLLPGEARRQALMKFGAVEAIKEDYRDQRGLPFLEALLQDTRYAMRSLRKSPSFTFLAIVILALGIGANTAIFTVVDSILLRPLPYRDPGRLIAATDSTDVGQQATLVALRQQARMADYADYTQNSEVNLTGRGAPARLVASEVSANLFRVLGVRPYLGRSFHDGEDQAEHGRVVLLSYPLWKDRFNGDPNAVGQSINIDDHPRTIVGVMPADFQFPSVTTQLWIPIQIDPRNVSEYWYMGIFPVVGRLRPGASVAQARAEFKVVMKRLKAQDAFRVFPNWGASASIGRLQDVMVMGIRGYLLLLLGAVGLVLLIACANFANLLVVRNTVRQKELAVRAALGAPRLRVLQQVLTESLSLAFAGGALGLLLAWAGTGLLISCLPFQTSRLSGVGINWMVLAFTAVVAILTGLGFGLIPAFTASKVQLWRSVRLAERTMTGGKKPVLAAFVIFEIAISVVVVAGAGLLVKSVLLLSNHTPGFDASHMLTLKLTPPEPVCTPYARCVQFYRAVTEKVRALPGVSDAAAVNFLPLSGDHQRFAAELQGHPYVWGKPITVVSWWSVTPQYLKTMRAPLLEGRAFTASDVQGAELVALVSLATAEKYWPGQDPIGKHIRGIWEKQWHRVIGVVANVHSIDLGVDPWAEQAQAYFPFAQQFQGKITGMTLVVRTTGNPLDLAPAVRRIVTEINSEVPVSHIQTMREVVENSISEPRSLMWLLASFAALALLLGAAGIYGVISYAVTQRTREMGIRMALGAKPLQIRRLVLGQSLRYAAAGLAVGLPSALAITRVLHSQLFEMSTADPLTYVAGSLIVLATALIAAGAPANRAARLDPARVIREE